MMLMMVMMLLMKVLAFLHDGRLVGGKRGLHCVGWDDGPLTAKIRSEGHDRHHHHYYVDDDDDKAHIHFTDLCSVKVLCIGWRLKVSSFVDIVHNVGGVAVPGVDIL